MSDHGFKIAKEGFSVHTAAEKNLVATSAAKSPKLAADGFLDFTASPQTKTYSHGLGYAPVFLAYVGIRGEGWRQFDLAEDTFFTTDTNFSATGDDGESARYFIFYDPILPFVSGSSQPSDYDHGFKIAEDGENVYESVTEKMVSSSSLQSVMIADTINDSVSVPNFQVAHSTTAHGFDYTPAFIATVKFPSFDDGVYHNFPEIIDPTIHRHQAYVGVGDTNVTCSAQTLADGPWAPTTVDFRVHLLNLSIE